ncbi:MAG: type I methionyl aminopeptidase [Puniceicoccales bacterium]|jgi:methionyl aminopeptidase|nr:type I methionyl aminopeptidase [Puniceicoccales bacterium]
MNAKNSEKVISKMRRVGQLTAEILALACAAVKEGMCTWDLEEIVVHELEIRGATGPCYHYVSGDEGVPFPAHICVSINDEVVHGIPRKDRFIRNGDVVSLDLVVHYDGFMGDSTRTVTVGKVSSRKKELLQVTEQALRAGIEKAVEGNHVGDISYAIQRCAEKARLGIVRELVGHGIGKDMHEPPAIPNWGKRGSGPMLVAGMTIAIEPMFMLGGDDICVSKEDGWTVRTADGGCAAHCEHTVLVTKNSPEVLTSYEKVCLSTGSQRFAK